MKLFLWSIVFWAFLIMSCDRELSVSKPDASPPEGKFSINSYPEGYEIYINGRITGEKTPAGFKYLDEKDYEISLKHPVYIDTAVNINVAEETEEYFVDIENHPKFLGKIVCRSYPLGADILLDGSAVGVKTPAVLDSIYPGNHKVRYKLFGYRDKEFMTLVKSNESSIITTSLKDTTVWMTYTMENCDIPSNDLNCIDIDLDNHFTKQIWIGSSNAGLLLFKNGEWSQFNSTNTPMISDYIGRLKRDSNDNLCAVSATKVYKFDDSNYMAAFPKNGTAIIDVEYMSFYTTSSRIKYDYYITHADGIMRVEDDKVEYYNPTNSPLCCSTFASIDSYRNYLAVGLVKMGCGFSIIKHQGLNKEWINFDYSVLSSLAPLYFRINYIKIAYREGSIKVFAAQYGAGLYIVQDIENKVVDWIPMPTTVKSIKFEGDYMWVCTFDGVYKILDNEIVEHYTMENSGLPSNVITDIWFDDNRDIYFTTAKGLCRYKRVNE